MTIISAIVLVVLLFVLVPSNLFGLAMMGWGMVGAGIAWLACNLVIVIMTRLSVRSISHTSLNLRLWIHFAGGILTGFVLLGLNYIWPINGILGVAIYLVLAFAVFFGLMIGVGELSKEDRAYFIDLVNPKKMLSYITLELKKE